MKRGGLGDLNMTNKTNKTNYHASKIDASTCTSNSYIIAYVDDDVKKVF